MKKINISLCSLLVFISIYGCSAKNEKPKITLGQYSVQAATSKGVVDKILHETDYKKMHSIALAVESSRAVGCVAVSDECNVLAEILNLIVKATNDGLPNEADNVAIYKLVHQLDDEYMKGSEKLANEWKTYINAHAAEESAK